MFAEDDIILNRSHLIMLVGSLPDADFITTLYLGSHTILMIMNSVF